MEIVCGCVWCVALYGLMDARDVRVSVPLLISDWNELTHHERGRALLWAVCGDVWIGGCARRSFVCVIVGFRLDGARPTARDGTRGCGWWCVG